MREFTYHVGQHVAPMDQAEHIPTEHMSKVVACRRDDNSDPPAISIERTHGWVRVR